MARLSRPTHCCGSKYARLAQQNTRLAAYVVVYSKDRWTGEAFIYLPGRADDSYRRNISTILRGGQDGHWYHASQAWSTAMNAHLP
jgi:hypothetical protein